MRTLIQTAIVVLAALALCDATLAAIIRPTARLSANFSSAFVQMEIDSMRTHPPETVVLGDSVLWGYRLAPEQTATSLLAASGARVVNLAFEGGSPVNTYAMLQLLLADGVRPSRVIFNINQKVFNPADSAYRSVHPSIWPLVRPFFSPADAALLSEPHDPDSFDARIDERITQIWKLYALRTDLREMLFGDVDASHALHDAFERLTGETARSDTAHIATPDAFEGTYDLSPLDASNISVHFLDRLLLTLRTAHIPAVAILTPTNHALLHDYIDTPEYERNVAFVRDRLLRGGVRVLDLDRRFDAGDFFDNDHLTAAANERFARVLAPVVDAP